MPSEPTEREQPSAGLPGVLRLVAGLAILALALIAAMVVVGALTREQLADYGTRVVLLAGIAALAAGGIAALVGWRPRR